MDLQARWPLPGATALRDQLVAAYAEPGRAYHDLRHLQDVLDRLDELQAHGVPFDSASVRLAAWFHDAVYDRRPRAEERSARWAEEALPEAVMTAGLAEEVARLVRLTEHHHPRSDDEGGAALCDADLAVLAAPAPRYRAYVDGVRREYAHVPETDFRAGRASVLKMLLDRPRLFTTEHGRAHWEAKARLNVTRELASLTAAPS